jgi:Ca2+ transporting ATPase
LFHRCSFIVGAKGELKKMTKDVQDKLVRDVIEPMACYGLRTISVAYRDFVPGKAEINQVHYETEPNWDDEQNIIANLTCIGIFGIEDPVRPEVSIRILLRICELWRQEMSFEGTPFSRNAVV